MENKNVDSTLFAQLVLMFHAAAMQEMGKVKSVITNRIERDLPSAQRTIDMLDMLKEKTKGNLTTDEEKLLTGLLTDLKLNYLDEAKKPESSSEKPEEGEA